MDHRGTGDSLGTAGEGSGDELQRPQHARVTDVLGLKVLATVKITVKKSNLLPPRESGHMMSAGRRSLSCNHISGRLL